MPGRSPSRYGHGLELAPARVGLPRVGRLLLDARAVAPRQLADWVAHRVVALSASDHEDRAGPVAGADEDVLGPGGAVDEVPGPQAPFLTLDEEQALAREHEEVLLDVLAVVHAVRLAGSEDVDVDPELREPGRLLALEAHVPARLLALPPERLPLVLRTNHPSVSG